MYSGPPGVWTQGFAQDRYVTCQVALFDEAVGPDRLHQRRFPNKASLVPDQHEQRLKHLRLERHRLPVAQQAALPGIETEGVELKHLSV